MGKEGKTKEVVEDREVRQVVCEELCVCDKVACERWCVAKKDGAQRPTRPSLALLHEANEKHHCAMQSALQQSRNLHTQVSHAKVTSIAKSPTSPKILT